MAFFQTTSTSLWALFFKDTPLYTALWRHIDKNSAVINACNRYLDFQQERALISLVNDSHVDSNLREISRFGLHYLFRPVCPNNKAK